MRSGLSVLVTPRDSVPYQRSPLSQCRHIGRSSPIRRRPHAISKPECHSLPTVTRVVATSRLQNPAHPLVVSVFAPVGSTSAVGTTVDGVLVHLLYPIGATHRVCHCLDGPRPSATRACVRRRRTSAGDPFDECRAGYCAIGGNGRAAERDWCRQRRCHSSRTVRQPIPHKAVGRRGSSGPWIQLRRRRSDLDWKDRGVQGCRFTPARRSAVARVVEDQGPACWRM